MTSKNSHFVLVVLSLHSLTPSTLLGFGQYMYFHLPLLLGLSTKLHFFCCHLLNQASLKMPFLFLQWSD